MIATQWWSILLVLLVSVTATIAITGLVVTWLSATVPVVWTASGENKLRLVAG
jgi:putative effector of murein hydrolase LrgA (UPF0299 family)